METAQGREVHKLGHFSLDFLNHGINNKRQVTYQQVQQTSNARWEKVRGCQERGNGN
jgi:hypothetical protein